MALTQKEIDELISSLMQKSASATKPQVVKPRLRVYDFRRPDKFSRDQLRAMQILFDSYCRQVTSYFSGLFRMAVQVTVNSVDQVSYQDFAKTLTNPCCVGIVSWGSSSGANMMINVETKLIMSMLERLCGGTGNPPSFTRPLTEIESAMAKRTLQGMADIFSETLKEFNLGEHSLQVSSLEVNPVFIEQALAPNDIVLSVQVAVKLASQMGHMEFCLPYVSLEPMLPGLSTNRWFSRGARGAQDGNADAIPDAIEDVEVQLSCRLGHAELRFEDVMSLTEGDVIDLDIPVNGYARLYVFGKPKFMVKVGLVGNRLAAQIIGRAEDGEGDPI